MKYGFKTIPKRVDWPTLLEAWKVGDELAAFDSGWLNDHFFGRHGGAGQHEAMALASALAAATTRLQIGHHVLANVYRHPVLLAKIGATIDHISGGRFIVGLGAGAVNETETVQYGWPAAPLDERHGRLAESVQIIKGLWSSPAGYSFDGRFDTLVDAQLDPPPLTKGGPPVFVGTRGRKSGMPIVARWADGLSITSDGWTAQAADNLPPFRSLLADLRDACADAQRDPSSLDICVRVQTADRNPSDLIAESRGLAENGATHLVFAVPAHKGARAVELIAHDVVEPLRSELGP